MNITHLQDRLRANLRSVDIPATEADIARVIADGYLERVAAFQEAMHAFATDGEPDYLAAWGNEQFEMSSDQMGQAPRSAGDVPATPQRGTIGEVAHLLRTRQISPVELTEQALTRIAERDGELNVFQLVLAEQAQAAAQQAEQELAAGNYRGPLHGVPIAAKDLLAMTDTVTTAGSKVFAHRVTGYDAAVVERLTTAGAIIVGKTRLSEFAYWPGSTNPHYGPTRNPWNGAHDTGGSSSGSAAAVVDGMAYGALGSDTGGSIRIPAALCGLVGLKPTFGRVSLYGCAPLSWSLDHLGPLTRSVEDAALMLVALAGHDARDPRTRRNTDFAVPTDLHAGVAGLRIGVLRDDGAGEALGTDEAVAAWQKTHDAFVAAGAELVEVDLKEMATLRMASGVILAVEGATLHAATLRTHYADYGEFCRGRLLGAFAWSAEDFINAQQMRQIVRQRWDSLFAQIDILSTPSQPDVAPLLGQAASVKFTNPFNATGWPAVSVPCGFGKSGLPLAVQLVGQPWAEATVLRAARTLEMASHSGISAQWREA